MDFGTKDSYLNEIVDFFKQALHSASRKAGLSAVGRPLAQHVKAPSFCIAGRTHSGFTSGAELGGRCRSQAGLSEDAAGEGGEATHQPKKQ